MGSMTRLEKQPAESRLFNVDFSADILVGDSIVAVQSTSVVN